MLRLISPKRARKILERYDAWIGQVSARYGVPAAMIKAILYQEMTQIDLFDPLADLAARFGLAGKRDSSTGHAQIFGYVGLIAANYAVERGMATYESLGIATDHALDCDDPADVRLVWNKLRRDPEANIELATINLLVAAEEVVGRTDFASFTDEEVKLVLTRYNADVRHVTQYGERAWHLYREFGR